MNSILNNFEYNLLYSLFLSLSQSVQNSCFNNNNYFNKKNNNGLTILSSCRTLQNVIQTQKCDPCQLNKLVSTRFPCMGLLTWQSLIRTVQGRHLRGLGAVSPPQEKRKKEKRSKKREKRKKRKKEKIKKGTINNVKILHIKCCFFQFFRWH